MAQRNDGHITHERILECAAQLFAERGFARTKVGDICAQASANVAAVNYHYGSKQELYREVWRREIEHDLRTNPFDGGVALSANPESRLRGRIRSMVRRFFHDDGQPTRFGLLLTREMASPTGLIEDLRREFFPPQYVANRELVRELLGPSADEQEVIFTQTSIVHQCLALGLRRGFQDALQGVNSMPAGHPVTMLFEALHEEGGVEELVDHIATFSLAGVKAIRERIAKRKSSRIGKATSA
ncbi:MAG: CerR family C-terminal domain-containing protein [Planctomycetes bacterium]|nr:CerR family C-terminal domain-containing protein [Planctomycetota bacterium]